MLEDLHLEQVAISDWIKEVAEELKALSLHNKGVKTQRIKEHKVTLEDCRYLTGRKVRTYTEPKKRRRQHWADPEDRDAVRHHPTRRRDDKKENCQ